jgi:hypothetical protein
VEKDKLGRMWRRINWVRCGEGKTPVWCPLDVHARKYSK